MMNATQMNAADKVLAADLILRTTSYVSMINALKLWDLFLDYPLPAPSDHENDLYQITTDRFDTLLAAAMEWFTNHRFRDIYARLAALDSFTGLTDRS